MVWAILPVFVFASQTVCGFRISPSIYQFKERPQNPLVPVIFKDHKSLDHQRIIMPQWPAA
jgi:hypothetical protein